MGMAASREREDDQRRRGGLERALRIVGILIIVCGFLFLAYVALL